MDWTNAANQEFTGQKNPAYGLTAIAADATDQTTGAFPGGSVRFRNAVTVSEPRTHTHAPVPPHCLPSQDLLR